MQVEQIYTGCLAQGAYYIESEGEVAIIDPLRETSPYIDRAKKDNATIDHDVGIWSVATEKIWEARNRDTEISARIAVPMLLQDKTIPPNYFHWPEKPTRMKTRTINDDIHIVLLPGIRQQPSLIDLNNRIRMHVDIVAFQRA